MAVIKVSDEVWEKFKRYSVGRDTADSLLRRVIEAHEHSPSVALDNLADVRRERLEQLFGRDDIAAEEKFHFMESLAEKEGKVVRLMLQQTERLGVLRKELEDELERLKGRLTSEG